jgi:large subunit ribosomal protein L4
MTTVTVKTATGSDQGTVELPDDLFGVEPHMAVMHQVVTAQLAARRRGTHSTQTRAEARGGGAKPWRQKGTGRARQGSIRAPHWRGGGVAHGPKPRDYSQRTPKKMVRLALRSALSDRAAEGKVLVVDSWGFDAPSTKGAVAALEALGVTGRALVVLDAEDRNAWFSFRNLQHVHLLEAGQLNAYDVLCSDVVVFTKASLPGGTDAGGAAPAAEGSDATDPTAAPRKKVVRKKVIKKVVKKRAPGIEGPGATDAGSEPRMSPPAGAAEGQES